LRAAVEKLTDLRGEVLGGGSTELGGDHDAAVPAMESD
jgi:hypothetical protein